MRFQSLALLLMYSPFITASEPDNWNIDDYKGYAVSLSYGVDEYEGSLHGIGLSLPFFAYSNIDASYIKVDTVLGDETVDIDQYELNWLSDIQQPWSFGAGYAFTGKENIIESEDKIVLGRVSKDGWFLQFRYILGEIKAYTLDATDAQGPLSRRIRERPGDFIDIERNGWGISTGLEKSRWNWRAGLAVYDYDRKLRPVRENLVQYYFQTGALDQIYQLSDREFYSDVMYMSEGFSLLLGFNSYSLYVSGENLEQLNASLEMPLSDHVSAGVLLNRTLDDSSLYSEASLSIYW